MEKKGFNLLRAQLTPEDRWDRVYAWVNGTARVIVVFVELVVIGCFAARIVVDKQARDLEKELESNHTRLQNLAQAESEIRTLQDKTNTYSALWQVSNYYSPFIDEIYGYDPSLFSSLTLSISNKGVLSISGTSTKTIIGDLETKMKNSESFSEVQVTSVRTSSESEQSYGSFEIQAVIRDYTRASI